MTDRTIFEIIEDANMLLARAATSFETSDLAESERLAQEALSMLQPFENSEDLGLENDVSSLKNSILNVLSLVFNRLASISLTRSHYSLTLSQAEQGLGLAERAGSTLRIGYLTNMIGNVYLNLAFFDKALAYYRQAQEMASEIGNWSFVATMMNNIGLASFYLQLYDQALDYYTKAVVLSGELGVTQTRALARGNIGLLYFQQALYENAMHEYLQALDLFNELEDKIGAAGMIGNMGEIYGTKEYAGYDFARAEEFLIQAMQTNNATGARERNIEVYRILAKLYEGEHRWEAIEYYKKYHELETDVRSAEARNQAAAMELQRQASEHQRNLAVEKATTEATTNLLHKILPPSVAHRLLKGEKVADYFPQVSILFADIVGFTPIAARMPAKDVLAFLNHVFDAFDAIVEKHGCEKIKTIGDGYLAAAGVPLECSDHAERLARCAKEIMSDISLSDDIRKALPKNTSFHIRIGLHTGSVFAGIVGDKRFVYDIYSDAVNVAARMESHGEAGKIHCSEAFALHLQNRTREFRFEKREEIEIKGKGTMRTYFLG